LEPLKRVAKRESERKKERGEKRQHIQEDSRITLLVNEELALRHLKKGSLGGEELRIRRRKEEYGVHARG